MNRSSSYESSYYEEYAIAPPTIGRVMVEKSEYGLYDLAGSDEKDRGSVRFVVNESNSALTRRSKEKSSIRGKNKTYCIIASIVLLVLAAGIVAGIVLHKTKPKSK